jgi:hypothetical protein
MPTYNVGDVCTQQNYDFMILRDDNLDYVVVDGKTNTVAFKDPQMHLSFNYARDNKGSRGCRIVLAGSYTFTLNAPLDFNPNIGVRDNYLTLDGQGVFLNTTLTCSGNFPAIKVGNMAYWELKNMRLSHNFAGYNTDLLQLLDDTDYGIVDRVYFHDEGNLKRGNGVGMINTGVGTTSWNRFSNCLFRSLNYGNRVDSVGAAGTVWTNANHWLNNLVSGCNWFLKLNNKAGDSFNHNEFFLTQNQTNTVAGQGGYDLDDAGQSDSHIKIIGGITWDLEATCPMLKVGPKSRVVVVGHEPTYTGKITGSGYGNGARVSIVSADAQNGWLWDMAGDGITKEWQVTHNLGRAPDRIKTWKRSRDVADIPMWVVESATNYFVLRFAWPPPMPSDPTVKNILVEWLVEDIQ